MQKKNKILISKQKISCKSTLWITKEEFEDNYLVNQATSSVAVSSPWALYEAGVICSRLPDGNIEFNPNGEYMIDLPEWGYFLSEQRVHLRRQNIQRPEREKFPWTGRLCCLFTRAWEIGRWKSHHKKDR